MGIGDRVAIIRKDAGLNQEEFSQRLMVSRSHISNIEKGKKEVDYNKSAHNYSYCCFFV